MKHTRILGIVSVLIVAGVIASRVMNPPVADIGSFGIDPSLLWMLPWLNQDAAPVDQKEQPEFFLPHYEDSTSSEPAVDEPEISDEPDDCSMEKNCTICEFQDYDECHTVTDPDACRFAAGFQCVWQDEKCMSRFEKDCIDFLADRGPENQYTTTSFVSLVGNEDFSGCTNIHVQKMQHSSPAFIEDLIATVELLRGIVQSCANISVFNDGCATFGDPEDAFMQIQTYLDSLPDSFTGTIEMGGHQAVSSTNVLTPITITAQCRVIQSVRYGPCNEEESFCHEAGDFAHCMNAEGDWDSEICCDKSGSLQWERGETCTIPACPDAGSQCPLPTIKLQCISDGDDEELDEEDADQDLLNYDAETVTMTCCQVQDEYGVFSRAIWQQGETCPLPDCPEDASRCQHDTFSIQCLSEDDDGEKEEDTMTCCLNGADPEGTLELAWRYGSCPLLQSCYGIGWDYFLCSRAQTGSAAQAQACLDHNKKACEEQEGSFSTHGCEFYEEWIFSPLPQCEAPRNCFWTCEQPDDQ